MQTIKNSNKQNTAQISAYLIILYFLVHAISLFSKGKTTMYTSTVHLSIILGVLCNYLYMYRSLLFSLFIFVPIVPNGLNHAVPYNMFDNFANLKMIKLYIYYYTFIHILWYINSHYCIITTILLGRLSARFWVVFDGICIHSATK